MSLPVRSQLRGNKRAPVTPYFLRLSLKRLGQVAVRHRMLADLVCLVDLGQSFPKLLS